MLVLTAKRREEGQGGRGNRLPKKTHTESSPAMLLCRGLSPGTPKAEPIDTVSRSQQQGGGSFWVSGEHNYIHKQAATRLACEFLALQQQSTQ